MLVPCQRFQNILYLIWSSPGAGYAELCHTFSGAFLVLVYLRNWHCLHLRHPQVADTHFVQKVMINSVMNFWKPSMLLLWYFISKNHDVIILKTIEFLLTKFSIIVSKFWWRQCFCDPVSPRFCDRTIFTQTHIVRASRNIIFFLSKWNIFWGLCFNYVITPGYRKGSCPKTVILRTCA